MTRYPYVTDLNSGWAQTYIDLLSTLCLSHKYPPLEILRSPMWVWLENLAAAAGDAGLALLRIREPSLWKTVESPPLCRYKWIWTTTMLFIGCEACGYVIPNGFEQVLPCFHPMRHHIGRCAEWDKWDEQASTLLFTDLEDLQVKIDHALENGILKG